MLPQVLLLLGSFVFAFCLAEAVHELGHFLAHRAYGVTVGIRLDPFGGSRILNGSSAPREILGITSAAGPLLNLLAGLVVSSSLWRFRRPALLPLLMWGPVALIQEGVNLSLGLLNPGADAELIVEWGVPAHMLVGFGLTLLLAGIILICWLLPLLNLSPADSFERKFGTVASGMVSLMVVRLLYSYLTAPSSAQENTVPLVFSVLLATILVVLYDVLYPLLSRKSITKSASITWPSVLLSTALAGGMILFQIGLFH
jgi:hypothetical protein